MNIRWLHVLRDVAFLFVLTFLGGLVLGNLGLAGPAHMTEMGLLNIFFSTGAFTISGTLTPNRRWPHLVIVAFICWVLSSVNMLFSYISFTMWIMALFTLALTMACGDAISYLIKQPQSSGHDRPAVPPLPPLP